MKRLIEVLNEIDYELVRGTIDRTVSAVLMDSRKVTKDSLFVCISGYKVDGHSFASEVIKSSVGTLIVEKDIGKEAMELAANNNVTIIKVSDTRYALAFIAAAFYDHPASKMKVVGITGTKGKTTTTYMVKSVLENAGFKVGLVGTIETIIGDKHIPSKNTTPDALSLQEYFKEMVDAGIEVVVMEVVSQGLKLHRTQGFVFDLGVFTNLSPDHIGPNEHADMDEYIECKSMLFRQCKYGIVNADDSYVLRVINGHTCDIETFGFNKEANLYAENLILVNEPGKLGIEFNVKGDMDFKVYVPCPGKFSVYNALTSIAISKFLGVKKENIIDGLKDCKVKGRIEMVETPYPFTVMIDYAHNALSLESILTTLREYNPNRIISVFGCGGNRSKDRRYGMGEVSGKCADLSVITSDNPRDEDPAAIIADIVEGIKRTDGKYVEIIDRKDAIRYAIENAKRNDIVVLCGKGHEDYQEIKGVRYPMDERVLIKEIIEEK